MASPRTPTSPVPFSPVATPQAATSSRPGHSRSKSGFSFTSHKSSSSTDSKKPKLDLIETDKERHRARLSDKSYVNPNRAITEAQPSVRALEASTLSPIRSVQHKDWQGNIITDPDSSNPARSRLERPLDTIRSFHAAADGGRKRPSQPSRPHTAMDFVQTNDSRRSSLVGSEANINPRAGGTISSPYGGPRHPYQRDGYEQYPRGPPHAYRRNPGGRVSSAPLLSRNYYQDFNTYPQHSYNDSYETNGESSGSPSEPWGTSTNPSSENSSIDRINAVKQPENDAYGVQHGRASPRLNGPIAEEGGRAGAPLAPPHGYRPNQNQNPPSPLNTGARQLRDSSSRPFASPAQRNVIQLGGASAPESPADRRPYQSLSGSHPQQPQRQQQQQQAPQQQRPNALRKRSSDKPAEKPKRQSWFKRKFGRNDD